MSIWHTSTPTTKDFPIWALFSGDDEPSLIRDERDFIDIKNFVSKHSITWTRAVIPQPPQKDLVKEEFWKLQDMTCSIGWLPEDWFRAGYECARKHSCSFDPWDDMEPYESAFDEKV